MNTDQQEKLAEHILDRDVTGIKINPKPGWFWQKNFREGMVIPLFGFNFRVGMIEGEELLLQVTGPTNGLLKQIKKDAKAANKGVPRR